MKIIGRTAADVAKYLETRPDLSASYPGLRSHPQRDLVTRQMWHPGGVMSINLVGGVAAARGVLEHTKLFRVTADHNDARNTINGPALMTVREVPREIRIAIGIPDGLMRLRIGTENSEDLIRDLETALDSCARSIRAVRYRP